MRPWELLDTATVPGEGDDLKLYRRGDEFSIKAGYSELMNSRVHGSEDALAELACQMLKKESPGRTDFRILIGGLGMGFTVAAALQQLNDDAQVIVAELVPAVIQWNKTLLSKLASNPLKDPRVTIYEGDVGQLIRSEKNRFDAILLDVDNGPEGLTRKENNSLYSPQGLNAASTALKKKGIFGVWSISPDKRFSQRLKHAGFQVNETRARARGSKGGGRHMIWLGTKSR